ncbi:hypothetical protein [Lactiplantibacillus mudanjiangensis]|uniref:Uncharacterized protein n=1 Tax=Lactiplantibacillus mudanjiangensis TaxID=1296538 RepID=A0A660E7A2_9LACO|nr:hypothetical protein [Lactiplantibacillus mudanjiangensis]VDG18808.1 hypothetical protein [Lactobacillus sp. CBA3605] [Lactiplantibacillus mudanjiangensis]VDG25103.1 hypothetical protein [Lactobacillus sp. CBA3605] [Lactiplantibacillus mudanjiangensis]VDG28993.1 hypothetical protein [Lactobacillus sp. CBA3605] [Lactiplantibacillus mudanjiangensis]VDG32906.1 hypothetical protein [Lactobacillus sp. CBA3605] [Lactiplantibacillus mudanjiangensis]
MHFKSIWRHTSYILQTLAIYFLLIQGPYDLWIAHVGYHWQTYIINIFGITVLFWFVECLYNWLRQRFVKRHQNK